MSKHFNIGSKEWVQHLNEGAFDNRPPVPPTRGASVKRQTSQFALVEYHGEPCPYCEKPMLVGTLRRPTRDHALPKSRGGTLCAANRVIVCNPCNNEKGDMTPDEYRRYRRLVALVPSYSRAQRLNIWKDVRRGAL